MTPFTPTKRQNMIAWLAARCDDPHYGQLFVYDFPETTTRVRSNPDRQPD